MILDFVVGNVQSDRVTTVQNHSELITNYFLGPQGEACQTPPSGSVYIGRAVHPVQEPPPLVNTLQLQHRYYSPPEILRAPSLPINIHELSLTAPLPWACSQVCLARSTLHVFERPLSLANLPCRPKPQCVCNFSSHTAVSNYRFRAAPTEACHSWRRYARHSATLDAF